MDKEENKIFINDENVKCNLIRCVECEINFTFSSNNICPLCEARIKGDRKALEEWKKILEE